MPIARCVVCGQLVYWRNHRGSRLSEVRCPICHGELRSVAKRMCLFHPDRPSVGWKCPGFVEAVDEYVLSVQVCEDCFALGHEELASELDSLLMRGEQLEPVHVPREAIG